MTAQTSFRKEAFRMNRDIRVSPIFVAAALAFVLAAASPNCFTEDHEIPFADAEFFFELNNTDGDLGIHALIDGDGWKRLEIEDLRERRILYIKVIGRLARQGLTQLSLENAEPPFEELPPKVFFRRFPAGEYEIEGVTLDGLEMESTAELRHVMSAPPDNLLVSRVPVSEGCEGPAPLVAEPVVSSWDSVAESHPGVAQTGDIEVVQYQVVVEKEEPTSLGHSVELPPRCDGITDSSGTNCLRRAVQARDNRERGDR
jgi:hypothetical protein